MANIRKQTSDLLALTFGVLFAVLGGIGALIIYFFWPAGGDTNIPEIGSTNVISSGFLFIGSLFIFGSVVSLIACLIFMRAERKVK